MEIKFTTQQGNACNELTTELLEGGVELGIKFKNQEIEDKNTSSFYFLTTKELTNFIGALLYLQSKLKK